MNPENFGALKLTQKAWNLWKINGYGALHRCGKVAVEKLQILSAVFFK